MAEINAAMKTSVSFKILRKRVNIPSQRLLPHCRFLRCNRYLCNFYTRTFKSIMFSWNDQNRQIRYILVEKAIDNTICFSLMKQCKDLNRKKKQQHIRYSIWWKKNIKKIIILTMTVLFDVTMLAIWKWLWLHTTTCFKSFWMFIHAYTSYEELKFPGLWHRLFIMFAEIDVNLPQKTMVW